MVALTEESEANTHGFSVGDVSANMLLSKLIIGRNATL
jgi:hypothetical protein